RRHTRSKRDWSSDVCSSDLIVIGQKTIPIAIPVAILYVSGIAIIVKKEGTAISNLSHSISFKAVDISTPTIISAGAVTSSVTTCNKGEKNSASKKNSAVTTDVTPVRPQTPTPEVDSTKEVVVDVPTIAPATVAAESANNALPARGSLLSFIKPACLATATSVPAVSKKSTNKNVNITTSISKVNISPKLTKACPKVGATLGTPLTTSLTPEGTGIRPKIIPAREVNSNP